MCAFYRLVTSRCLDGNRCSCVCICSALDKLMIMWNSLCFFPTSYKTPQLALVSPNGEQYDSLLRQLRDRMEEGCGETIYVVGMGSGKTFVLSWETVIVVMC